MSIEIIQELNTDLTDYEKVSIAFAVKSQFRIVPIESGLGGLKFVEESVVPYVKDYDEFESERPSQWQKRFDISRWGIFAAFEGEQRVGGAAVAWQTSEVEMLEGREDLACLWDLRVASDYRSKGIGHKLFSYAAQWARERRCRRLKIETQNINVSACRFYARQGCQLKVINSFAYDETLNEIQFLWYLDL
jgi:GNAT superfamily N-acetyltransferase